MKTMKIMKAIKKIIISLLTAIIVVCSLMIADGYSLYKKTVGETDIAETISSIVDSDGFVGIDDLPDHYINAVIAVEDERFYAHGAVDALSIGRAIVINLKDGKATEGGSTITQQIAKNLFFTQKKELQRKIAEVFAAIELESRYSKAELLEIYVNTIYFGSGFYGIRQASIGYFGKEPAELSPAETSLLAGIPNAPSVYDLNRNPELACQRQVQVITKMVECGYLTQTEGEELVELQG